MQVIAGAPENSAVLIADDSPAVRMDLRDTFAAAGFSATICETIAAARAVLARQSFSLVVLGLLLPDGDGTDLLREIKSMPPPALPVMLLSTERGLETGADDYIGMPYDGGQLLARARHLMGRAQHQPKPLRGILLIDDSPVFRAEFQRTLETAGYSVTTAANGEAGLRIAFAIRSDAIIVDGALPGSLDGPAVVRRLKQDVRVRNTPCILLTRAVESGEELQALEAGADAYLTKQMDAKIILARIAAMLRCGPAPGASLASLRGAKRILAVDDSATFLNKISSVLRLQGYGVVQAAGGKEALELLELQPVDCILLDVFMPGLSGIETCRIIRQRPALRNVPVLMLTSAEGLEAVIEGINAGADDYISKSADLTVLKARVRAQLRRKQFEDECRSIREELLHKELDAAQAHAAQEIAEARAALVDELERRNRELEAFTYSVSHDLRAPLRSVCGFIQALLDDFAAQLPPGAQHYLERVQRAAQRMNKLIDALLELSRTSRAELHRETFDMSGMLRSIAGELAESASGRRVEWLVEEGLTACGDAALIRVAFNNLLENAWKFTSKTASARIAAGALGLPGEPVYFVRDNGVGFDSSRAKRLFEPFERMHPATEYPGAGVGLATVRRIIERHQGKVWAESGVGQGSTFFLTLNRASAEHIPGGERDSREAESMTARRGGRF